MSELKDFLKISHNSSNKKLKAKLRSFELNDSGHFVIYIPSIQVSSYGKDRDEARQMMDVVLNDFAATLMLQPLNKVISDLKTLGWIQSPFFKTELSQKSHIDAQGILRDFDMAENTEINESLVTI